MNKKLGNIAVVFWEGHLNISPSILNLILLLEKKEYYIHCYIKYNSFSDVDILDKNENINICKFGKSTKPSSVPVSNIKIKPTNQVPSKIRKLKYKIAREFKHFLDFIKFLGYCYSHLKHLDSKYLICVDLKSLCVGGILKFIFRRKIEIIYFSLEIRNERDFIYNIDKLFKKLERYFNKKVLCTITQDTYRLDYLSKENHIRFDDKNSIIIPNGYIGKIQYSTSSYLHEKFNLDFSQKLVVSFGGFNLFNMIREIAESSTKWDAQFKLLFHSTTKVDVAYYYNEVCQLSQNKAIFSDEVLPIDEIYKILNSCYIGLALYDKNMGPNMTNILGASGKMIAYLRCGLPVIAFRDLAGFEQFFKKYQCGILIDHPNDIAEALLLISSNYSFYSSNALKAFELEFEFENAFNQLFEKNFIN